jgi:ABC-type sugar transport system, permease component
LVKRYSKNDLKYFGLLMGGAYNMEFSGKKSKDGIKVFDVVLAAVMVLVTYATLYPFLVILFASISDPIELAKNPIILYPRSFYLATYDTVLHEPRILLGFKNSVVYTVLYTVLVAFFTTAAAYPLSIKSFKARKPLLKIFLFPWFFSGGLIPTYIIVNKLGLVDTMWAVILPGMVGAYNLILVRTFIEQLPGELLESAIIDGANDVHIFFKLIIPLSMPIIATISLWAAVAQWNNYFGPLLYFTNTSKYNLQVFLRELVATSEFNEMVGRAESAASPANMASLRHQLKASSLKPAVIVISTIPIFAIYPFVQKYFVKGIMVGAIKG